MSMSETEFVYNPDTYQDGGKAPSILPTPGHYRIRCTSLARRRDRATGEVNLYKGKWPTIVLNRVEVEDAEGQKSTFPVFQEIFTMPFERAPGVYASKPMDLLRSIDVQAEVSGFEEAVEEVEKLLASGESFVAATGYGATDTEWAKSVLGPNATKEEKKKVWDEARLTTKNFKNPDGSYRTATIGKLGNTIEAKLVLANFVPSDRDVPLGPYKNN